MWHIQHSNCVSLAGQWGIEVLNPILNLYLSYRGGGDVVKYQPYAMVSNSEGLNMDEQQLGVLASPLVAGSDCDDIHLVVVGVNCYSSSCCTYFRLR